MAETKTTHAEKTPEEKAVEAAEKEQKERTEFIDKVVKEISDRVKKNGDLSVIAEIKTQIASLGVTVMGTNPVQAPEPEEFKKAAEQSPIIAPVQGHISQYDLEGGKKSKAA